MPFRIATLLVLLSLPAVAAQVPDPGPQSLAEFREALIEARDLQATELQTAREKLTTLLAALRNVQESMALNAESAEIFGEALLLQIGIQTKLLAPEEEIYSLLRELLIIKPTVDDILFNPRQKLLFERVRVVDSGRLSIRTTPPGGSIIYLGNNLGETPLELPLVEGTYPLLLRKEGFRDQEIEVTMGKAEILILERTLRKSSVEVPLSLNTVGATVRMNGTVVGQSQDYDSWISGMGTEERAEVESIVTNWNIDTRSAGFFKLSEVPVEETINLEFQAPCYEGLTLQFTVAEGDVDWNRMSVAKAELRNIELSKDTGFIEVTSTPSGADVWIDGALQGKTPLQADVCVGTRSIQVLHRSGQYVREVILKRGQVTKVTGEVKPALAFLGIYRHDSAEDINPDESGWEVVARQLALRSSAFINPQLPAAEVESLRKSGRMPLERLLRESAAPADMDSLVKQIANDAGRVNMILFGTIDGEEYRFRLFSTIYPTPDEITLPNLGEESIDFLTSRLNEASAVEERIQAPSLGMELIDSSKGLIVLKINDEIQAGGTALPAGSVIRSVDRKQMTLRELRSYLRTREQGQSVTMEIESAGTSSNVTLPVLFSGAEYPWSMPDGFFNSVLTMLHHLVEREPASDLAKYANLSLARGLMQRKEWNLALEILSKTNLEPHDSGVCPGTVLYYQGRCYEEIGETARARTYYSRARDFVDATLGVPDGLSVPDMAEHRLQNLRNQPQ